MGHYSLGLALENVGKVDEAIIHYARTIQLLPKFSQAHLHLGMAYASQGKIKEAIAKYREALQLSPESPRTLNKLAWMLATNADPRFRNGGEALRLARHSCKITDYKDGSSLHALGAAYAETGNFVEALQVEQQALLLALANDNVSMEKDIRRAIELYNSQAPFRE